MNCGQTCIAPDYILVKSETKESLVKSLIIEIENAFGSNVKNSKDYGRIINKKHFEKLENDLKGQNILYGGIRNKNELFFGPTIVDNPKIDSLLIKEEIFGPILPILSYNNLEDLDSILSLLKKKNYITFSKKNLLLDIRKPKNFDNKSFNLYSPFLNLSKSILLNVLLPILYSCALSATIALIAASTASRSNVFSETVVQLGQVTFVV